jgi:hypothetical protein
VRRRAGAPDQLRASRIRRRSPQLASRPPCRDLAVRGGTVRTTRKGASRKQPDSMRSVPSRAPPSRHRRELKIRRDIVPCGFESHPRHCCNALRLERDLPLREPRPPAPTQLHHGFGLWFTLLE